MSTAVVGEPVPARDPVRDAPFWGICLGHTSTHWYPGTLYILLPYIATEMGFTLSQVGFLMSVQAIVKAACNMPVGAITDMTDRKSLLMALSLILAGVPYLFMGAAHDYWLFMLLVAAIGVGNQMWHPASFAALSTLYPKRRGYVFGLHGMAANVGDLLAPAVIGSLLVSMTWREVVGWNVIPGIIVATAILLVFQRANLNAATASAHGERGAPTRACAASYGRELAALFRNRSVLVIALASGFRTMAQQGLMIFLPIYFAVQLSLSPVWVGAYVALMQVGGVLAAPWMGALSDRVGRRRVLTGGMIAASVAILLVVLVRIEWLLIAVMALLGFFLYSLRPVMQAWALESADGAVAGTVTSLLFMTQSGLGALSPFFGGLLADRFGIVSAFYFLAAVILVGNVLVHLVPGPRPAGEARAHGLVQ